MHPTTRAFYGGAYTESYTPVGVSAYVRKGLEVNGVLVRPAMMVETYRGRVTRKTPCTELSDIANAA